MTDKYEELGGEFLNEADLEEQADEEREDLNDMEMEHYEEEE